MNYVLVARKPVPHIAKFAHGACSFTRYPERPDSLWISIPAAIFSETMTKIKNPDSGEPCYCKKPSFYKASQLNGFGTVHLFDEHLAALVPVAHADGDFQITKESGLNLLVKRAVFETEYISQEQFISLLVPD
jgi:hypothetical protein